MEDVVASYTCPMIPKCRLKKGVGHDWHKKKYITYISRYVDHFVGKNACPKNRTLHRSFHAYYNICTVFAWGTLPCIWMSVIFNSFHICFKEFGLRSKNISSSPHVFIYLDHLFSSAAHVSLYHRNIAQCKAAGHLLWAHLPYARNVWNMHANSTLTETNYDVIVAVNAIKRRVLHTTSTVREYR